MQQIKIMNWLMKSIKQLKQVILISLEFNYFKKIYKEDNQIFFSSKKTKKTTAKINQLMKTMANKMIFL